SFPRGDVRARVPQPRSYRQDMDLTNGLFAPGAIDRAAHGAPDGLGERLWVAPAGAREIGENLLDGVRDDVLEVVAPHILFGKPRERDDRLGKRGPLTVDDDADGDLAGEGEPATLAHRLGVGADDDA